jgi:DNA-binding beta-propeller fold protein YncE
MATATVLTVDGTPDDIAVDPDGNFVFVSNSNGLISQFQILPGGQLSHLTSLSTLGGSNLHQIAIW